MREGVFGASVLNRTKSMEDCAGYFLRVGVCFLSKQVCEEVKRAEAHVLATPFTASV